MPGCYFSRRENRGVPVVGWTHENEVQQGEEMPGVRPADEEERSDREGVQRWKCASCSLSSTMPQENTERAGQLDAFLGWLLGRASQSACDANGDSRALRKRTAWCRNIRPAIPPCRVKHHTVMADGTYMNHGWCLVIAIDGGNGEVPGFQWCSNESKAAYMALFSRIPAPDVPITDGLRGAESACNVQRCLVHVLRNTRVDLTNRPKSEAGGELLGLARRLVRVTTADEDAAWLKELNDWHGRHDDHFKERTTAKQDPMHARGRKWRRTHERLRRAHFRLVRLNRAGVLFALCDPAVLKSGGPLPSTTNQLKGGVNAVVKRALDHHRGLSEEHMRRCCEWTVYMLTEQPGPMALVTPEHRRTRKGKPVGNDGPMPGTMTAVQEPTDGVDAYESGFGIRKGWVGRST